MILSTLDKSRKGGAYEQIPSLVLGQRWTPQLNSRNMMKVVLCVWIEPYIENDLSFCVWPVHTPTTSKEVLTLSASTSPLPYTGNKSCIVNTILSVMPKHTVYIDPCMGSAEVYCDRIIQFCKLGLFRFVHQSCGVGMSEHLCELCVAYFCISVILPQFFLVQPLCFR